MSYGRDSGAAERIVDRVFYAFKDGGILGVTVMLGIARDGEDYGGTLAITTLSVVN